MMLLEQRVREDEWASGDDGGEFLTHPFSVRPSSSICGRREKERHWNRRRMRQEREGKGGLD
jgi:hypothetical protein